jgi:DNA-binding transcriptional regulator YiaG
MNKFSKELVKSMGEACEHAEGKRGSARVHVVEVPDVRAIRRKLRMSQSEFAERFRIPLPTLKNWEQGGGSRTRRRRPIFMQLLAAREKSAKLSSCN